MNSFLLLIWHIFYHKSGGFYCRFSSGLNWVGFLCGSVFFKKPKHQIKEMYASEKRGSQ